MMAKGKLELTCPFDRDGAGEVDSTVVFSAVVDGIDGNGATAGTNAE